MSHQLLIVGGLVLVALAFDFINGFHDAANSIATVVSTRVLSPRQAVIWAASFWIFRLFLPARVDKCFRGLQLASAALFSLSHGTNDAQKTMGIIDGVLFTAHMIPTFSIPLWVVLSAHAAIALGTLAGGW